MSLAIENNNNMGFDDNVKGNNEEGTEDNNKDNKDKDISRGESGDEEGGTLSRYMSESSVAATEDEDDDEDMKIELGPQCTLKEQLAKDKDDESLRRWKERLLGSVDINSVGEIKDKVIKTNEDFVWAVEVPLTGKFIIEVEFLDFKTASPAR